MGEIEKSTMDYFNWYLAVSMVLAILTIIFWSLAGIKISEAEQYMKTKYSQEWVKYNMGGGGTWSKPGSMTAFKRLILKDPVLSQDKILFEQVKLGVKYLSFVFAIILLYCLGAVLAVTIFNQ